MKSDKKLSRVVSWAFEKKSGAFGSTSKKVASPSSSSSLPESDGVDATSTKSLNGKRRQESATHASAPSTKRSKLSDESAPIAPLAQRGFDALVHPLTFTDFVTRFWEPSRLVHFNRPYNPQWNAALVPSLASKLAVTAALSQPSLPAYYLTDVQLIGYSDADDDLIFDTPNGGAIDLQKIWQSVSPGSAAEGARPALHLSNPDLFSKDVAKLLEELEPQWKGDGAIAAALTVASPGTIPFAVHADGQAQFILQIRGRQTVTVLESVDGPEAFIHSAGEEAFPCFTHGPNPEVIIPMDHAREFSSNITTIELSPGSTLFLPPSVKIADIPKDEEAGDSISLTIYLSPQPSFKATLDTLLSLAVNSMSEINQQSPTPSASSRVPTFSSEDPAKMEEANSSDDDSDEDSEGGDGNEDEEGEGDSQQDEEQDAEENWSLFPHEMTTLEEKNGLKRAGTSAAGVRLNTVLSQVLQRASHLAPKFVDSLLVNTSSKRSQFLSAIPHVHKQLGAGLESLLQASGGLLKLSHFFPAAIAESIHQLISHIPDADWQVAYASENATQNNIDHAFHSARTFASHHALFALFKRFMPQLFGDFSVGKYTESHFIAPHDDRAYKEVNGEHFSRHIAVIYYCSKDWKKEYGGQLVDMVTGKEYVPEFNSIVAFSVPRFHEVKPVLMASVERYTVFGWFFKPGINYELWNGE